MENEEIPPRMETLYSLSTETSTVSSGSLRTMSKNSRAGKIASPGSRTSASRPTVMPVSRLYPESLYTCAHENPLERGNGALLRDGPAGDGKRRDQQIFFTGKFQRSYLLLFFPQKERIIVVVSISSTNLCGKVEFRLNFQDVFFHSHLGTVETVVHRDCCETSAQQLSTEFVSTFHSILWIKNEYKNFHDFR